MTLSTRLVGPLKAKRMSSSWPAAAHVIMIRLVQCQDQLAVIAAFRLDLTKLSKCCRILSLLTHWSFKKWSAYANNIFKCLLWSMCWYFDCNFNEVCSQRHNQHEDIVGLVTHYAGKIFVFHEDGFQIHWPSQGCKMITNVILCFLKENLVQWRLISSNGISF